MFPRFFLFVLPFLFVVVSQAHDGHPLDDNMCGSPGYGDCVTEEQWVRGWYSFLCHNNLPGCVRNGGGATSYSVNTEEERDTLQAHSNMVSDDDDEDDAVCWVYWVGDLQRCLTEQQWICVHFYAGRNSHSDGTMMDADDCM